MMDDFTVFVSLIGIILGITCIILIIILFFKVWGMTNDVGKIRRLLESKEINL